MGTSHCNGLAEHGAPMYLTIVWFVTSSMGINVVCLHIITIAHSFLGGMGVAVSVSVESWLTKVRCQTWIGKPSWFKFKLFKLVKYFFPLFIGKFIIALNCLLLEPDGLLGAGRIGIVPRFFSIFNAQYKPSKEGIQLLCSPCILYLFFQQISFQDWWWSYWCAFWWRKIPGFSCRSYIIIKVMDRFTIFVVQSVLFPWLFTVFRGKFSHFI